jgi:hypothetical protein
MSDLTAQESVLPSIEKDVPNGIQDIETSLVNGEVRDIQNCLHYSFSDT